MTPGRATCVGAAIAFALSTSAASAGPPLTTRSGVVAADDAEASKVGAGVLARGGNAVDAAVATALALGVVEPVGSGIGGGGFAVVYVAAEKKTYVYDFRETAPAALDPGDFVVDGKVDPMLAQTSGLGVGVPGEVAGLDRMHRDLGALSWRRVVTPAARLARDGAPASKFFAERAAITLAALATGAPLRVFLQPIQEGQIVVREDLAGVLLALAAHGADAFYRGPIADDIVATVTAAGGVMTADDLTGYAPVVREPLWGSWHGMKVATMPLPSSGGVILLEVLGLLDALDARGISLAKLGYLSADALHVTAQALEHGFADRARFLGDATGAQSLAERILDPADLRDIAAHIDLDGVQPHDQYGHTALAAGAPQKTDHGTSHLCVIDADGNAVSLTTTVNSSFGAKLVTKDGVVLNDEVDDFSLAAGVENEYHLVQGELNLVGPGKRPLSSMTPTLLFDGDRVVGCIGGSGGPRIISNVVQVLLDMFVYGQDVAAAIAAPRIHHQWSPDRIVVEPAIPEDVRAALAKKGYPEVHVDDAETAIQAIRVHDDGTREAASEPRKYGAPAAQP
jgi:gamma-glutamyltranspeptidase/glutathione hydrolase